MASSRLKNCKEIAESLKQSCGYERDTEAERMRERGKVIERMREGLLVGEWETKK